MWKLVFLSIALCATSAAPAFAQSAAGGQYHSTISASDGTVWSWGYNLYGRVGDNTQTNRPLPVNVSTLSGVVAVADGTSHSLALKSDGTVLAWGLNSNGQLGNGNTTQQLTPVSV